MANVVFELLGPQSFAGNSSSVVEVPHTTDLELAGGTIALSFTAADTNGTQGIFSKDASGFVGGGNHFAAYLDDDTLTVRLQDGTDSVFLEVPGIVAGQEYEFALTFDSGGAALWIDGVEIATTPFVMDWASNQEFIQVGALGWASATGEAGFSRPFEGTISDVEVYDDVLSEQEIAVLADLPDPNNTPPDPVDDAVTVEEDGSVTFDPLINDSDPDGDPISVADIANDPTNGEASVENDGTVTYTPDPDFFGTDSFDIEIEDGRGGTDVSTVTVTVTPVDDAPIALDDSYTFDPATGVFSIGAGAGLLVNDVDPDGGILTAYLDVGPDQGTVTLNPDGSFDFLPDSGFIGTVSFTYFLEDSDGVIVSATVTLEALQPTNEAPVVITGSSVFTPIVVDSTMDATHAVVAADFDGDGDIDLVSTSETTNTVAWFENDGSFGFTRRVIDSDLGQAYPVSVADIDQDGDTDVLAGGYGADEFVVYLNDGNGGFSTGPVLPSDGAHSIYGLDFDGDGDIDLLTSSQDANQVSWYENTGGMNFVERVIDNDLQRAKTAVAIDVDGDGDLDVIGTSNASDTVYWYENDGEQNFTRQIVDANVDGAYFAVGGDFDGDGSIDIASVGQNDNTLSVHFNDGEQGFTRVIIDPFVTGARAVEAADIDLDGDLDLLATARDGNLLLAYINDGAGNFTRVVVDPASDGVYGVSVFDINLDSLPDITTAVRDSGEVMVYLQSLAHDAAIEIGSSFTLSTEFLQTTDPDNVSADIVYTLQTTTALGTFSLGGETLLAGDTFTQADIDAGLLVYLHTQVGAGAETLSLLVSDGTADRVAQPLTLTFTATSGEPIAGDDLLDTPLDTSLTIDVLADLLANDVDPQGDALSITGYTQPENGTLTGDLASGTLVYTPDAGFTGTDTFSYTLSDGSNIDTGVVAVAVSDFPLPVYDVPGPTVFDGTDNSVEVIPHDPIYEFSQGTVAFRFTATDLNDAQGLFTKDATGFSGGGNHLVAYLDDGNLVVRVQSANGSETLTIDGVSAGVAHHLAITFSDTGAQIYLDGILAAQTTLVMDWTVNEEFIQWGGRGWGSESGLPDFDAPFDGIIADRQIYDTALDPDEVAELATGLPVNGVPTVQDDTITVDEDGSVTVDPLINDSDPEGDPISVVDIASDPANGVASIESDGTVTYTPDPDFFGTDTFDLVIADINGNSTVSTVTATVTGSDDDPVAADDTAATTADTSVTIDVIGNDTDADGDALSVVTTGGAENGQVTVNPDGTIVYTPDAGFLGTDTFTYEISDGAGTTDTATVSVTVTDQPVLPAPIFTVAGVSVFDGNNSSVINMPPDPSLATPDTSVAFSFVADDTNGRQGIVSRDASFFGDGGHFAVWLQDDELRFRFQDDSASFFVDIPDIVAGQEYEIATNFGSGGVEVWVDGTLVASNPTFVSDWTDNAEYLQLGGLGWGSGAGGASFNDAFNGGIADFEIFDQALVAEDIMLLAGTSSFDLG